MNLAVCGLGYGRRRPSTIASRQQPRAPTFFHTGETRPRADRLVGNTSLRSPTKAAFWHVSALPGLSLHSPIEVRHTTASRDMPPLSTLATVGTSRAQEVISFLEPSRLTVVRPALRCVAGSRPRHQEMRVHWMRITIRDCNTPSGGAWRPRTACCASIWGCVVIICFGTRHLCTT